MKPKNPKVTVLMPVYNAEKYLREAIESILSQTFKNFEFLIINDGSTDKSKDAILSYNDPRIIYSENSKNLGIAKTLNKGMNLARGNYIARMDGDDISHPDRLQEQIEFMDDNRHVGVCGTWLQTINNNKEEIWKSPIAHEEIRSLMLFHDAIYHPTVVIRRDIIKNTICVTANRFAMPKIMNSGLGPRSIHAFLIFRRSFCITVCIITKILTPISRFKKKVQTEFDFHSYTSLASVRINTNLVSIWQ